MAAWKFHIPPDTLPGLWALGNFFFLNFLSRSSLKGCIQMGSFEDHFVYCTSKNQYSDSVALRTLVDDFLILTFGAAITKSHQYSSTKFNFYNKSLYRINSVRIQRSFIWISHGKSDFFSFSLQKWILVPVWSSKYNYWELYNVIHALCIFQCFYLYFIYSG